MKTLLRKIISKENRLFFSILGILVLTAIVLSCYKLSQPGLYYDEMLFANAAVGGKTDSFVALRLFGIPVLLMEYIGAIKSWLYYPLFAIAPVNYWTVRLPAILLGLAGNLALVSALYKGFGRAAAITGAVMILLDPTCLLHSRVDFGPFALMVFFRGFLVLSLVNWIKTSRPKWAWLALLMIVLGIFDKLNFVWMAAAALGTVSIFYWNKLKDFTRNYPKHAILIIALLSACMTAAIIRSILISQLVGDTEGSRIAYAWHLLRFTLCGGGLLDFVAGDGLRVEKWFWPPYLLIGIIAIFGLIELLKDREKKKLFICIVGMLFILLLAFVVTRAATGVQHSSMISGIWQLILAPLVGSALHRAKMSSRSIYKFAVAASLLWVGLASCGITILCINEFAKPANPNWDPAFTSAANFAKKHNDASIIVADWGMGTQIIGVTKDKPDVLDAWPAFDKVESASFIINNNRKPGKDTYIYTRLPEFASGKEYHANLISALEKDHIKYELVATFPNWKGEPMVQILKIPVADSTAISKSIH